MKYKRLLSMGGFGAVAALPAGSNFMMTLFLVRMMTVHSFASWSIIEPTFLIFSTLTGLGLQFGLLFVTASSIAKPRDALGTALTATTPVSFIVATMVWVLIRHELPGVQYSTLVFALVAEALSMLTIASMRGQRLISRWVMFEVVRSLGPVAFVGITFLATSFRIDTVEELLRVRGACTMIAVLAVAASQGAIPGIKWDLVKRMLSYGFPIALASGVTVTVSGADRFLLALLDQPAAEIATYAAHQRLAGLLTVAVITPLNMWFAVEAIQRDTVEEAAFFRGVLVIVTGVLSLMMVAAFVAGPIIWPLLFPRFAFNPLIYGLLAGAVVPQAIGIVTNIGALREKNTHVSVIVAGTSGTVMTAVGLALVGPFGGAGAAAARFAALASTAIVGRTISQRIAPVTHHLAPVVPFIVAMAVAIVMLFAPAWGSPAWPWALGAVAVWGLGIYSNRLTLQAQLRRS